MKGGKIRIITVNNSNISDINKLINNKNQNSNCEILLRIGVVIVNI